MHELSIAMNLIEVATAEARQHAGRIVALHVRIGLLSGVVGSALQSAFALARSSTPLADAKLIIEEVPIMMRCPRCRADRRVVSLQELSCVDCGSPGDSIISGRELELAYLEVEQ